MDGASGKDESETWHSVGIARRPGQIRRLRRDRSHAQPPLGGEHGEDPQFDRAEHDAMLRPRRGAILLARRETSHQASRVKRSAYRIANWFIASFQ